MRLWASAFLSGILLVQQLASLPSAYFISIALVVLILFKPLSANIPGQRILILIGGFAFGFGWALGYAHLMMNQRLQPQFEGVDLVIEGQISSLPITAVNSSLLSGKMKYKSFAEQRVRFDFNPVRIVEPHNISIGAFPEKIRLSWYRARFKLEAGQNWRFMVRLKRPYGLLNPGGFDYERQLFQKRIQARGYIKKSKYNQMLDDDSSSSFISRKILQFRQSILNRLSQHANNESSDTAIRSLTQALILGYRGGIDASQWQVFQRTGTIHLMAISGLHIGLIAGMVYLFSSLLWRLTGRGCLLLPAPQAAAIMALLAATFYAMLAGFTIPTQRALLMLSVAMMHLIFKRTPLPASKTIALALILVLLFDPLAVLAQGFWLSFLAVIVIIYLMRQPIADLTVNDSLALMEQKPVSFIGSKLQSMVVATKQFGRIQWAITIAMFPVILYFYQSSSLVSPLANFIAIPVMSLAVVPLMFMAIFFLYTNDSIATAIFKLTDIIYTVLWQFLETLSHWQYASLDTAIISPWDLVFSYLAILLWLAVKGSPMRWLAIIFVLPIVFNHQDGLENGEARVTVLDVGQGLSAVIQTKQHTVVFDTGPKYSQNFDTGRVVLVPFLRYARRAVIDTLIISHGDNDHIGGFDSVMAMLPVKRVLTSIPEHFTADNINLFACHVGQQWQYDGVQFSILSPLGLLPSENGHDENNQSCVLKISTQYGQVLIAGDIERETESYLYHSMPTALAAEVLVVPHHGSNTSSLTGFIRAVKPDYAVFSVGYKNRYKLPNKRVVKRYQQYSAATLLNSYQTGAVTFNLQAKKALKPNRYRPLHRRYWHTLAVD